MKTCLVCGEEKALTKFRPNPQTEDGYYHQCRDCVAKGDNGDVSVRNNLYSHYVYGAVRRNLEFTLAREQFHVLTRQDCWYCGQKPSRIARSGRHTVLYNGIDRVENDKGYTEVNCIPCCTECNRLKRALDGEVFVARIRKIAAHLDMF